MAETRGSSIAFSGVVREAREAPNEGAFVRLLVKNKARSTRERLFLAALMTARFPDRHMPSWIVDAARAVEKGTRENRALPIMAVLEAEWRAAYSYWREIDLECLRWELNEGSLAFERMLVDPVVDEADEDWNSAVNGLASLVKDASELTTRITGSPPAK